MIKKQNQDLIKVLFFYSKVQISQVYKFQLAAFLCSTLFIALQIIALFKMYSTLFAFLWIVFELMVLVYVRQLNKRQLSSREIVSFAAKQNVLFIMEGYTSLRYIKFLALLCNFLGVVGAIKSMRIHWEVDWSLAICIACLFLSYYFLKASNELLMQLRKSIDIYNNFEIVVDPQIERAAQMGLASIQ